MPDGGDALLCALATAGAERIGSDVDVRAVVVLVSEPAEVTRCESLLQRDDTLDGLCRALRAKQESNRLTRSEATSEKVFCGLLHLNTSFASAIPRALAGEEARWLPGLFAVTEGPMRLLPR